jgi:hypothetical protein
MTTSYDPNRDVLNALPIADRGRNPARYAAAVTLDAELPIYGRLWVCNAHATDTETINVVLASNASDDSTAVSFHVPPLWAGELPVIARRILGSGTGADISAVVLA